MPYQTKIEESRAAAINTLRTIATFPVADPQNNMDALNMQELAKSSLRRIANIIDKEN